jgi:hypothetical protein
MVVGIVVCIVTLLKYWNFRMIGFRLTHKCRKGESAVGRVSRRRKQI